jgi:cyclin T
VSGGRFRSWYLSHEEIERGSLSQWDGVSVAREAELHAMYCCFIRDICTRLQL